MSHFVLVEDRRRIWVVIGGSLTPAASSNSSTGDEDMSLSHTALGRLIPRNEALRTGRSKAHPEVRRATQEPLPPYPKRIEFGGSVP